MRFGRRSSTLRTTCGNWLLTRSVTFESRSRSGATAIANALYRNDALARLNLEQNELGQKGGCALAAALRVNATLSSLDLSRNDIGDVAAKDLAESCRDSASAGLDPATSGLSLGLASSPSPPQCAC